MKEWLLYSFLTLFFWGLWAVFPRLAVIYLPPRSVLVYQVAGQVVITLLLITLTSWTVQFNPMGALFAGLAGAFGTIGFYFYSLALQKGNASVVTALTSLYPLIAVILFLVILREVISVKQGIGIVFALLAVLLVSS